MRGPDMLRLAQDLEWVGCELEYYGHKHAMEGFPNAGPTWNAFLAKRRGVMATAAKIERELKSSVRFNPTRLVGIEYPMDSTLDSIAELLAALENIKHSAEYAVQELPGKVRNFTRMVDSYLGADRVSVP
jgi:hypothetical protein